MQYPCGWVYSYIIHILEFAKLDLDISASFIKGKRPTAIMAIHMSFCYPNCNVPRTCWQEHHILVFKLFVKYWLKFIAILLKVPFQHVALSYCNTKLENLTDLMKKISVRESLNAGAFDAEISSVQFDTDGR